MGGLTILKRIPVLRILVPFIAGILLHGWWHTWYIPVAVIVVAVAAYLWLRARSRTPQQRLRWRPHFILPLAIAALALGWLAAVIHCPPHLKDSQCTNRNLTGRVTELEYTDFSMRLTVDVLDNDLPPCRVLISTRGCDYTMRAGDIISWKAALEEVGAMGNPDEMDYAGYLLHTKGIRYQQHLPASQIRKTSYSPTLITRMANVRRDLQQMVSNSRLAVGPQRFVVALLLGNSDFIDKATRQEFAAAGVAHVLALSGLHVGFIALIIWWLMFPLDYLRLKHLRLVITLMAIAAFAVFTGLSPSVVRATVMTGMVFASLIFHRRSVSLNALALSALLILLFQPSALYSVGFQLSFITVAAVLMFARLPKGMTSRFQWVNGLSSTVLTSLVAMLATVALSAHYFHTVSLMSVLSNLLILPVLPVFMVFGALFLLVTAAGLHWQLLNGLLDVLYRYIHWATGAVNVIPLSHVSGVYVSTAGVVTYFVLMALVVLWLYRRNYRYLLAAGCVAVIMVAHSLWIDYRTPKRGLVIFNAFTSTPILYYDHGTAHVWTPDGEDTDSASFARFYSGFLAHHSIDTLRFVANDSVAVRLNGALFKPPYAHLMGHRMVAAGSGKWKHMTTTTPLAVDEIIVTKRFHGTVTKLRELYRFDRLIISGAMQSTDLKPLLRECDSLNINAHRLAGQGAYCFPAVE